MFLAIQTISGNRRTRRRAGRRGQTVILALAVLFLLTLLGSIFVTALVRNLQRVSRHDSTDIATTLSLSGLQYAAEQFRASTDGADWRPRPSEFLWKTPTPPAISVPFPTPDPRYDLNSDGQLDGSELRALDPDAEWLSNGYVRVPTGRGRFLIRVTYQPSFKVASATSGGPDVYDPNSAMLHIESVGRPGDFDPNDPTSFALDASNNARSKTAVVSRKVEALVPVGLVDQLWWITNLAREQTSADLGVPAFKDGNGNPVQYTTVYRGSVRSNRSVRFNGQTVVRVYPARGEGVSVRGEVTMGPQGNVAANAAPQLTIVAMNDTGGATVADGQNDNPFDDSQLAVLAATAESKNSAFATGQLFDSGGKPYSLLVDDRHAHDDSVLTSRSARDVDAPKLTQLDVSTGTERWLTLTRDSGGQLTFADGAGTRQVNSGAYGLTDLSLPPQVRASGLFLDNIGDIQYASDRDGVKDEWLQRGSADVARRGWVGDYYIPSVVENGVNHPIAEVQFVTVTDSSGNPVPKIRITQYHMDQYQNNTSPATGRRRQFYNFTLSGSASARGAAGSLTAAGFTRDFDYPTNGVFYAAGSIRVRGTVGAATVPKQLTVVSGGTIYVEGNLLKGNPGSFVGLLAQDYVTLNPTAFTRVHPGDDVIVEADTFDGGKPSGYHFTIQQGSDLEASFSAAQPVSTAFVHVKHSAVAQDSASETAVALYLPRLGSTPANPPGWPDWNVDRYNFGGNIPPSTAGATYGGASQLYYLFHQLTSPPSPTAGGPYIWTESNAQTVGGSTANFERKSFTLGSLSSDGAPLQPGQEATLRFGVGPKDGADFDGDGKPDPSLSPNGQPYWLSKVAIMPKGQPLSIKVQAVIYAYTKSWFVIPAPFFNDNPADTRANFLARKAANTLPWRATGTLPADDDSYPFYNEPLPIRIELDGAVSENAPAPPSEQALWIQRSWLQNPGIDMRVVPEPNQTAQYAPDITYTYDHNLRRMVRVRFVNPYFVGGVLRDEEVAWTAPSGAPAGVRTLGTIQAEALANNSYIQTLPVLPHLPASAVVYEGSSL